MDGRNIDVDFRWYFRIHLIKMDILEKQVLFVVALLSIAVIEGLFTGIYTFVGFTEDIKQQLLEFIIRFDAGRK